jgi:peptidoglycan/LPS O-acetylase OafA/YrhL
VVWVSTYAWTPSRADGLALGALIALARAENWPVARLFRLAMIGAALSAPLLFWAAWRDKAGLVETTITTPEGIAVRTFLPAAAALFCASLLIFSLDWRPLARILSGRFPRAIARYSYGMYVFHWMLLQPLEKHFMPRVARWPRNAAAIAFFAVGSTLTLVLAVVSYHGYESFFLSLKSRFTGGKTRGDAFDLYASNSGQRLVGVRRKANKR